MDTGEALSLPHVAALCRAIDDGDDSVLTILADALEEIGDPRADGLRLASDSYYRPRYRGRTNGIECWEVGAYGHAPTRSLALLRFAALRVVESAHV